jgi:hypothetical protein
MHPAPQCPVRGDVVAWSGTRAVVWLVGRDGTIEAHQLLVAPPSPQQRADVPVDGLEDLLAVAMGGEAVVRCSSTLEVPTSGEGCRQDWRQPRSANQARRGARSAGSRR